MSESTGNSKVRGQALADIPWEDRPEGCTDVLWRYSGNPVIPRDAIPSSNSVFNSAVVPLSTNSTEGGFAVRQAHDEAVLSSSKGGFAGVFRCDNKARHMQLHAGFSDDGISWRLEDERIEFTGGDPEISEFAYGYDPRVIWIEDRYWVTWCNGYHGPTIGVGYTHDFKTFHQTENAYLPYNRNGVLFPRKIRGTYAMLSRPSDRGHTPFGDMFYSQSPDMIHWGRHRHVMSPAGGWQSTKIGPGPCPIETHDGWLLIYHGVLTSCNGFVYSAGAALLDLDEPWKVIHRTKSYLISPQTLYECVGDVPNVVFPCAALVDAPTGRMAVYYGAADTVTGLAFAYADEILDFLKEDSKGW